MRLMPVLFQPFHHGMAAKCYSIVDTDDNAVSGCYPFLQFPHVGKGTLAIAL
jgi:hypothetical protein